MAAIVEGDKPKPKGPLLMSEEHGYAYAMVKGIVFPPFGQEAAIDELRETDWSHDGDIMIATYPKCGTTWMQQIVLLMLAKGDASKVKDPMTQSPWVDREYSIAHKQGGEAKAKCRAEMIDAKPDPAFGRWVYKTHCPWELFPCGGGFSKGKIIVVARNPKDAAISMHKHYLGLPAFKYTGPWSHFFSLFMQGNVGQGSWWDHVASYDRARKELGEERLLWLNFEELKADPQAHLRRIAEFLGIALSDDELAAVHAASSFDSMKEAHAKREEEGLRQWGSANHFRSGTSGGWRSVFTVEQSEMLDKCLAEKMAGCPDVVTDYGGGVVYRGAERQA